MAFRTVYGNTHGENGWPMVDEGSCAWVNIPGTDVRLQIQNGQPLAILRAFAADFHAYIEPLRDRDSACWTPTNSVSTSNHLSGTAMDLNWESHPFRVADAGFDVAKLIRLRALLSWYEDTVFWGNDWQTPKDAMHFQMGYDTYGSRQTADFIARKIRADGYSTYQRGSAPVVDKAQILAAATGLSYSRAADILPAVTAGLRLSECVNPLRIAMWLAQMGHESDNFNATEEYAKNGRYAPYIGRTWIQITWDYNYRAFGKWACERGIVPYADYFVDYPTDLASMEYAGVGPAWYWTVQRPDINRLSDAGDVDNVTFRINGGYNGINDRKARYTRALAQGDSLLALIADEQPHEPTTLEELLMSGLEVDSLSIYAEPVEPKIPIVEMIRVLDAKQHRRTVHDDAIEIGDQDAIRRIVRAAKGLGKFGEAPYAVNQAKADLAELEAKNPDALKAFIAAQGAAA